MANRIYGCDQIRGNTQHNILSQCLMEAGAQAPEPFAVA